MENVATEDNLADALTESLPQHKFKQYLDLVSFCEK